MARSVVSRIAHDRCLSSPREVLPLRWWEALDTDFHDRPEGFQLGFRDRVQVSTTAAADVVLRTVGACLVGSLALPLGYNPWQIRSSFRDADFYGPLAESRDAERFYRPPPPDIRVVASRARGWPRFRPADGKCEDLAFESPFEPLNPAQRKPYLKHAANRIAHARYWRHLDGPRPTVMAIHGFSADLYFLNEWFFALPWFYQQGFDVLLFTLPFHGARQTRFSPFSGHGFFAGGMSRINEAIAHAVHDFRAFMDWLQRSRGVQKIGVTGVSLGGYTAAVLAAVERRLEFVIPNVPLVSIPDLVLEWQPIGVAVKGALRALRRSLQEARHLLAVSSPLTYFPVLPHYRLLVIGGVGDRLAPPKHSRLLWEHWGRCRIHWFPGSHLVHLDRGNYLRQVRRFVTGLGFIPPGGRPPE